MRNIKIIVFGMIIGFLLVSCDTIIYPETVGRLYITDLDDYQGRWIHGYGSIDFPQVLVAIDSSAVGKEQIVKDQYQAQISSDGIVTLYVWHRYVKSVDGIKAMDVFSFNGNNQNVEFLITIHEEQSTSSSVVAEKTLIVNFNNGIGSVSFTSSM
jgi:hypothetical protein